MSKRILLFCLLLNIAGLTIGTGYWFSETRADKSPLDSFEFKRKDVPTALHCGSFCSGWEECTEYALRQKFEDSSDDHIALECIASVGNVGCRGNESEWKVYRKRNTGISTKLVEDDCAIKVRSGVKDKVAGLSHYTVSCDGKPTGKTFFCELKLHKSSGSKIDGYSYLYVGDTKIVNLAADRPKVDMPRVSSGTWKAECPDQAVIVEMVLAGNAELISGACRYLLDNYKIGPKVEVEMQTDTETGGWSAKCPLYEMGIHVLVGFRYDGNIITHIICSVLKYKE